MGLAPPGLGWDRRAQSGLVDAVLFIGLLILATVLVAVGYSRPLDVPLTSEYGQEFAEAALETFLRSTVNHTSYPASDEGEVSLDDHTCEELVVVALYLESSSDGETDTARIETDLNQTLARILNGTGYHCELTARSGDHLLTLRTAEAPARERWSADAYAHLPSGEGVSVVLVAWLA